MAVGPENQRRLPLLESARTYEHPLYGVLERVPGLSIALGSVDRLLSWGSESALWIFPMATSCCGIELMAAAASRVDIDRMGSIVRASPRQADVMVVAGTITVKMAPRVKMLWEQMPEPKWAIAMGSCAISGDFYRDLYSVVPGIDTFLPVDVYVPGCPPNPEALMHGLMRLQEKVRAVRAGTFVPAERNAARIGITKPCIARIGDPDRDPAIDEAQIRAAARRGADPDAALAARPGIAARGGDPSEAPEPAKEPSAGTDDETSASFVPADAVSILRAFGVTELPKDAPPIVPAAQHVALARALRAAGYRQLVFVAASHWPAGRARSGKLASEPEHVEVAYALRTIGAGSRVVGWTVRAELGEPVPTLVGVFAGADWQEREQLDLVGVAFEGHPDPRRLMMPEDWSGHPLRKDYPADAHAAPWR